MRQMWTRQTISLHTGIGSIEFVYTRKTGDEVKREFMVQEVTELGSGSIIVVEAMEHMPGAKPWEFYLRLTPVSIGRHEWLLETPGTKKEIAKMFPRTKKYWIWRLTGWHVLGINDVIWLGLLILLWYNFG